MEQIIHDKDFYSRYGWGRFRPDCLQFLNRPGWLVTFSSILLLITSANFGGVLAQTSERRFHMTSTIAVTSGIPASIVGLISMLVMSHYADRGNKVKWITYTSLCFVASYLLSYSLRYTCPRVEVFGDTANNASNATIFNSMCRSDAYESEECHIGEKASKYVTIAWYTALVAGIMGSIGVVSHGTSALTYVDENVDRNSSMFYTGIMLAAQALSMVVAIGVGAYSLTFNEDFDRIDVSKLKVKIGDANWIGAWWLPSVFMIIAITLAIIPFSGFPRKLPKGKRRVHPLVSDPVNQESNRSDNTPQVTNNRSILKELPIAMKTVLTTPVYICGTIRQTAEALIIIGFIGFFPKYLEFQYGFSTEFSALLPGLFGLLPAIIGTVLGSWIAGRLNLSTRGIFIMAFLSTLLALPFGIVFFLPCPATAFAGVNVPYDGIGELSWSHRNLSHECNLDCHCSKSIYDPHCGLNGLTYYSPCFAGCKSLTNCTCPEMAHDQPLKHGKCSSPCYWQPILFCVFTAMASLIIGSAGILVTQSNMVAVPFNMRTLALGIQLVVCDLFGIIPAGPVFARIFDSNCILWKEICNEKSNCLLYDTYSLANSLSGLCLSLRLIELIALYFGARWSPMSAIPATETRQYVILFLKLEQRFFGSPKQETDHLEVGDRQEM